MTSLWVTLRRCLPGAVHVFLIGLVLMTMAMTGRAWAQEPEAAPPPPPLLEEHALGDDAYDPEHYRTPGDPPPPPTRTSPPPPPPPPAAAPLPSRLPPAAAPPSNDVGGPVKASGMDTMSLSLLQVAAGFGAMCVLPSVLPGVGGIAAPAAAGAAITWIGNDMGNHKAVALPAIIGSYVGCTGGGIVSGAIFMFAYVSLLTGGGALAAAGVLGILAAYAALLTLPSLGAGIGGTVGYNIAAVPQREGEKPPFELVEQAPTAPSTSPPPPPAPPPQAW
jgi:hypothetical protein